MGDDGNAVFLERRADLGVDAAFLQAFAASDQEGGSAEGSGFGADLVNGVTAKEDLGRVFQNKIFQDYDLMSIISTLLIAIHYKTKANVPFERHWPW